METTASPDGGSGPNGAGETVSVRLDGEIAVVTIRNPPVNALSFSVREPLHAALTRLQCNEDVRAVVIACDGRTFIAGADIKEFGQPARQPDLRALVSLVEGMEKPVVAAIHGTALGGGLELALGCRFRVADAGARLGLPEVKLGLLPGAGGTVRLPALVGATKALEMIASGEPVSADEALRIGLVDAICEGALSAAAVAFARARCAEGNLRPAAQASRIKGADLAELDRRIERIAARARGLRAPLACAEAVRNAVTLGFEEALARERALFLELVQSDQSRAQRHLFFAERQAGRVEDIGRDVRPRTVARVGIVGAGTMGGGIAMAFADGGLPVVLVDAEPDALARGLAWIERNYAISAERGSITQEDGAARLKRIAGTTDLAAVADCDLIVEAVFEDMDAKTAVLAAIAGHAGRGAVIATNTSYLDVDRLGEATGRPEDFAGAHFFSPANVMRLVEIVRGRQTAPDVLATLLSLARTIGKVPVVVGVCHGFVGNRMLAARSAENEALLMEGADVAEVDAAFTEFGWPMGPFAMADLAGLDIGWRNRRALGTSAPVADWLCENGHFGQKTGLGFYAYADGRTRKPNPELEAFVRRRAEELGIERRAVSAEEIAERTLHPLVNEGARILQEGIAARASDIDLVWVHGYGFPKGKGGPMFWAERTGYGAIAARLDAWHARTGRDVFLVSERLRALAAEQAGGQGAR